MLSKVLAGFTKLWNTKKMCSKNSSFSVTALSFDKQHHWITQQVRLASTSGDYLVQPSCSVSMSYSRLPRTVQISTASRNRSFYNPSGKPVPVLGHAHSRKVFPVFGLSPLPLVLSLGMGEKSLDPSSCVCPPDTDTHWQDPPDPSLL